jgi:hypothetical protein
MVLQKIYNSFIFYNDSYDRITRDYYEYVVSLINSSIDNNHLINIIVGDYHFDFNNDYKTIYVNINFEHTLVKYGGRDSPNAPFGNITISTTSDYYMVRIQDYHILNKSDIVIEYSIPNIMNIKTLPEFDIYSKKLLYIAPVLYPYYNDATNRSINCLTTFIDITQPRRALLLENIQSNHIEHINVNNCFDNNVLQNIYKNTKIMINIHQTDHHHTFEELRVLPALLSGIIVICEESPLKECIPYSEYVIWSTYENIITTIKHVENNYEKYHSEIFGNDKLKILIQQMHENNKKNIIQIINNISS